MIKKDIKENIKDRADRDIIYEYRRKKEKLEEEATAKYSEYRKVISELKIINAILKSDDVYCHDENDCNSDVE